MSFADFLGDPELMAGADAYMDKHGGNRHGHKCDKCGATWEHDSEDKATFTCSYDNHHRCPRCGEDQRYKYWPAEGEVLDFPFPAPLWPGVTNKSRKTKAKEKKEQANTHIA